VHTATKQSRVKRQASPAPQRATVVQTIGLPPCNFGIGPQFVRSVYAPQLLRRQFAEDRAVNGSEATEFPETRACCEMSDRRVAERRDHRRVPHRMHMPQRQGPLSPYFKLFPTADPKRSLRHADHLTQLWDREHSIRLADDHSAKPPHDSSVPPARRRILLDIGFGETAGPRLDHHPFETTRDIVVGISFGASLGRRQMIVCNCAVDPRSRDAAL
jgi:hypothetical protein